MSKPRLIEPLNVGGKLVDPRTVVDRICPRDYHLCHSSPSDDMEPLKGLKGPGGALGDVGKYCRPTGKLGGTIECCGKERRP